MKIIDTIKEVLWAITGNKVRSGLTILGIVIGIASVITLVSIGQGAQNSIASSIESIGSNLIIIFPGAQRGGGFVSNARGTSTSLTYADSLAIKKEVSDIAGVAPEAGRRYQVTTRGKNTNTQVTGTTPDYPLVRNVIVASGSFIADSHLTNAAKVAVLGPTTRDDLFGTDADPIGQTIRINGNNFKVIGVTTAKGGSGFNNADDVIYIPLTTAQKFLTGGTNVTTISIAAKDQTSMPTVQTAVTELLLQRHSIGSPELADFSVLNQADIVSTASSVTTTLTILLASIAGISLMVGGIGIMNMMLTTVTERTREIGLRKALGARRRDITLQFLIEAIVLTFIGGTIGVILGWIAAAVISQIAQLSTAISLSSIVMAFGVSAGVGIVFGYYPARRASRLSPIEALRHE